jgi:hypothetical protein
MKLFKTIFSKELPVLFRVLNLCILLPTLLWPAVAFVTAYVVEPMSNVLGGLLGIAILIYPVYLLLVAYLNALLFRKNAILGIIIPVSLIWLAILGCIAVYL